MMTAVGCLLHVPDDRSDLLLFEAEHGRSFYWTRPYVSELVPGRDHNDNRGAPPPVAIPGMTILTMRSWV